MQKKTKKRLIIVSIIILAIVAIVMIASVISFLLHNPDDDLVTHVIEAEPVVTTVTTSESVTTETPVIVSEGCITPDVDDLFNPKRNHSDIDGLLGDVLNYDMKAMELTFDNIVFKPGINVSDIVDTSYWYTVSEHEMLEPGEACYVVLSNDFWSSDDIRLSDLKVNTNGNVVLWVHNYTEAPCELRDCTIYKYQISFTGCYEYFSEHPVLNYRDKYSIGQKVQPDVYSDYVHKLTDMGYVNRFIYGEVDECQVILDFDDDNRFMGISVSYNELYGPDFGIKEGDINE